MNETVPPAATTNDTTSNMKDDEKKDDTTMTSTVATATTSASVMMVKRAVDIANEMTSRGTTYLHTKLNDTATNSTTPVNQDHNPTGAVVVPISLATTFQQNQPGVARAPNDPNSFGMGYEYSRTGKRSAICIKN